MSLNWLHDRSEAFLNQNLTKIDQCLKSEDAGLPSELKAQLLSESESLLMNYMCFAKNLDKFLPAYRETSLLRKNLEEIRKESKRDQEKLITASNSLDNLLREVKNSMKNINQNIEANPEKIIDFAAKINPSLKKSGNMGFQEDFCFPSPEEIFWSQLSSYSSKRSDDYLMKSTQPVFKILSFPVYDDEITVRASGPISMELSSRDKSLIRYTLDCAYPTTHIGIQYSEPIEIRQSCMFRAVCYKPGFRESELLERRIEIGYQEGNFYMNNNGARRPEEDIDSEQIRYSFYETPFTPSSNIQMTPHTGNYFMNFTPQYTPNRSYKEEEEEKFGQNNSK